jgi:hypothetical protein
VVRAAVVDMEAQGEQFPVAAKRADMLVMPMCGRRIWCQGRFNGAPVRTETTTSWIARVTAAA